MIDRTGTILVVEDDDVVAETLELYLSQAGHAVSRVVDGRAAVGRACEPDVALVILDWMIPGLNGQEVCRQVRRQSTVPILMLTARTTEADRLRGFESGADDYVPKPFSPREVVARVEALLRRTASAPAAGGSAPLRVGRLEVDAFRRIARLGEIALPLTPTELRLLETLARHPGRTFTRDELVGRTFGPDYDGLDRSIDTHVTHLRRKLSAAGGDGLVVTVHGLGYRLVDDAS
jgi:two-component system response regulator AdeR